MSATRTYVVYGFATTHDAMTAERVLEEAGVPFLTIPTPRALGELCGLAIRVAQADAAAAERALDDAALRWSGRIDYVDRTVSR